MNKERRWNLTRHAAIYPFLAFLAACAPTRHPIEMMPVSDGSTTTVERRIASLEIVNRAEPVSSDIGGLGGSTTIYVQTAPPFPKVVADDIRSILERHVRIDDISDYAVRVIIHHASMNFRLGAMETFPFVGMLFVGTDKEFTVKIDASFEVVKDGQVVRTYGLRDKVVNKGSIAFQSDKAKTITRMVELYRTMLKKRLVEEFVELYL